ncbi:MAG: type II toxin-antitoxin system ParD family antitoxin [Candidatus Kapabacteria bacterium]|nr:type II toxin-antitoxin system ParD family antitoxin [Candidatus Kapabacteria bacterium]
MGKNTSISLGSHFESFITHSIECGRYNNASEVVRAGLRLLEAEEVRFLELKQAITAGIESGIASGFHPDQHLSSLKKKKRINA